MDDRVDSLEPLGIEIEDAGGDQLSPAVDVFQTEEPGVHDAHLVSPVKKISGQDRSNVSGPSSD